MLNEEKSDIGNFYGFLREYNDHNKQTYSYLSGTWPDLDTWKTKARGRVLQSLLYEPEDAPLDPVVLEVIHKDGYRREEIEYSSGKNTRVRGTILIPENGKETHPTIVALHDHGGFYYYGREKLLEMDDEPDNLRRFKEGNYGGRSWATDRVKSGYVVFVIDAFYFGSRKLDLASVSDEMILRITHRSLAEIEQEKSDDYIQKYNGICSLFEPLMFKHILTAGTSWAGILSYDDRKSIDYLFTRKEVDKDRIACCGLSIGGFRSALLAGTDPRIKASVVAGWMPTFDSLLFNRLRNHTFMIYMPGLTKYMDLPDIVSITCPNPLFVQQCIQDSLYNLEGMQTACGMIKAVYDKAGVETNFRSEYYDNHHEFNLKMQQDAFEWLDQWLKP